MFHALDLVMQTRILTLWTFATIENHKSAIFSSYWSIKKELTTLGLNGGVIFLALRSSQLMGEKNMWFLISICEETQLTNK